MKQRRRWIEGLLRLIVKRGIPLRLRLPLTYSVICWALAPLQFIGFIIPLGWLLHTHGASPAAWWVGLLWSFNLSFQLWQYVLGFRINNRASADPAPAWHAVALVPLLFVFSAVELCGAARRAALRRCPKRPEGFRSHQQAPLITVAQTGTDPVCINQPTHTQP